ncbi:MAG TPA: AIPR family protein [Solirubrobacteraceae bacterium]|jgi:hypothetical protein
MSAASDVSTLIEEIDSEVVRLRDSEYESDRTAFAHVAVAALFDLDDDEAYEAAEVGRSSSDGPDAYWHDEEGRRSIAVLARYEPGAEGAWGRDVVRDLEATYGRLTSGRTRQRRDKLGSVSREIAELRASDREYPVEVWAVCFGTLKRPGATELKRLGAEESDSVSYHVTAVDDFLAIVREKRTRDAPAMADPVELTLHDYFPYHQADQPDAIVANLDALELAKLEQRYGYRLFQSNVRYLLQGRQRINEDIASTLNDPAERRNFWYYNNGIAIICDSFDPPADDENPKLTVHNLQIVNGCQTTATLARTIGALEGADPPVRILARIIAASDDVDLREYIPLYNNRQNAVKDRDLQSNDDVQTRLQREFASLSKPWFYIRKRGEWEARGNKSRYGDRRIENDVAAQAYYAFFHDPGVARARKRYLFARKREGGLYEEIFHPDTSPASLLLPYRLAQFVRPQVAKYRREIKDIRPGRGSASDQKKLLREWLKFGEQYVLGAIGWHLRRAGRLTDRTLLDLATKRFDGFVATAYPLAVRDLDFVFRRVGLEQPVNDEGVRERVDYANYVKGHWPDVLEMLTLEWDTIREGDDDPLAEFVSS